MNLRTVGQCLESWWSVALRARVADCNHDLEMVLNIKEYQWNTVYGNKEQREHPEYQIIWKCWSYHKLPQCTIKSTVSIYTYHLHFDLGLESGPLAPSSIFCRSISLDSNSQCTSPGRSSCPQGMGEESASFGLVGMSSDTWLHFGAANPLGLLGRSNRKSFPKQHSFPRKLVCVCVPFHFPHVLSKARGRQLLPRFSSSSSNWDCLAKITWANYG